MDKILNEEVLSMEELDTVSGGNVYQTAMDTEFLRDIGLNIKARTTKYVHQYFKEVSRELINAWKSVGVFCPTISTSPLEKNTYTDLKGNPLTRKQAMEIAMKAKGVSLDTAAYGEK